MFLQLLTIAVLVASAPMPAQDACPLLGEPPEFTLNCRIPVDGHDWRSRRATAEGEAVVEVTISGRATLLDVVIVSAVPEEIGPIALRSMRRACWGVYRVAGTARCYRARIPVRLKPGPG